MKLFFSIIWCLISCNYAYSPPKVVRKHINNGDIHIYWYYLNTITETTADYVSVKKGGEEKEIYNAERVITDVVLDGHNIILKLRKPSMGVVYTQVVPQSAFDYKIILDSMYTVNELSKIPEGKLEE